MRNQILTYRIVIALLGISLFLSLLSVSFALSTAQEPFVDPVMEEPAQVYENSVPVSTPITQGPVIPAVPPETFPQVDKYQDKSDQFRDATEMVSEAQAVENWTQYWIDHPETLKLIEQNQYQGTCTCPLQDSND
jgi:hypothetical protein